VIGEHEVAFAKWLIDQGGVFAILLVILHFYRRDFKDIRLTLSQLVEQNITALRDNKAAQDRLARALELNNARRRVHDDNHGTDRHGLGGD